ncbi:hypothetical protein P4530_03240 [Bacillus thuringiensis]|nr:hypothetical protein [Bacillus thuringiensis]
MKHFEAKGIKGLEEKCGKVKRQGLGRPRTKPEDPEAKMKRLEAENDMLEKGIRLLFYAILLV